MSINDYPLMSVKASMTDDDNVFHSDLTYFRALLNDISELAQSVRRANRIPISMSDELDSAITAVQAIR